MSDRKPAPPARKRAAKKPKAAEAVAPPAPKPAARVKARRAKPRALREAKFRVGEVVRHKFYPFRGIVFDVDPVFNSTEEWWQSIPEDIRPKKDQPFYHLLAENEQTVYIAYVSEQNLLTDETGAPLRHPQVPELFVKRNGRYVAKFLRAH